MGNPVFLLQIVENQGHRPVVMIPGGGQLEIDLIETCVKAVVAKGVGIGRTEAQVTKAIRDGLTEAISGLKAQTRFVV